jgi:hypothetical protein
MIAKLSDGVRPPLASFANAYPSVDPDGFNQEIDAVVARLVAAGKSPADALALLRATASSIKKRHGDRSLTGWSVPQMWAAFELALLCGLREIVQHSSSSTEMALELAFAYAQIRENQLQHKLQQVIADMIPDFRRGRKVREAGRGARGSWSDRYRQAEEFRRIDGELSKRTKARTRSRSAHARHGDIARVYCSRHPGKSISSKTVGRRLQEFPVPMAILEMALRGKLLG